MKKIIIFIFIPFFFGNDLFSQDYNSFNALQFGDYADSILYIKGRCEKARSYFITKEKIDTILVPLSIWNQNVNDVISDLSLVGKYKYILHNKEVDSAYYQSFMDKRRQVLDFFHKANGNYCKFLYEDNSVCWESLYHDEYMAVGYFKSYYRNGKFKEEGTYCYGKNKIDIWKYYNEAGELIRTEIYDEKGILLKTIE